MDARPLATRIAGMLLLWLLSAAPGIFVAGTDISHFAGFTGAEVLLFEVGGFAYGAFVAADTVIGLQSGDPAWVDDPDGCTN